MQASIHRNLDGYDGLVAKLDPKSPIFGDNYCMMLSTDDIVKDVHVSVQTSVVNRLCQADLTLERINGQSRNTHGSPNMHTRIATNQLTSYRMAQITDADLNLFHRDSRVRRDWKKMM